jgi:hypothetical protein
VQGKNANPDLEPIANSMQKPTGQINKSENIAGKHDWEKVQKRKKGKVGFS